jgi:hypothetical protein
VIAQKALNQRVSADAPRHVRAPASIAVEGVTLGGFCVLGLAPLPATAAHIEAVYALLPSRYKLPLLVLDATGMRLGELEQLTWVTSTSRADAGASRRLSRRPGSRDG